MRLIKVEQVGEAVSREYLAIQTIPDADRLSPTLDSLFIDVVNLVELASWPQNEYNCLALIINRQYNPTFSRGIITGSIDVLWDIGRGHNRAVSHAKLTYNIRDTDGSLLLNSSPGDFSVKLLYDSIKSLRAALLTPVSPPLQHFLPRTKGWVWNVPTSALGVSRELENPYRLPWSDAAESKYVDCREYLLQF